MQRVDKQGLDMKTDIPTFPSFTLVSGVGNYADKQACLVSAAVAKDRFRKGMDLYLATDSLECCCPVIKAYAIQLNDSNIWTNNANRTKYLLPCIDLLLDTRGSRELRHRRHYLSLDYALRVFTPLAMECAGLNEQADTLRNLKPITDEPTRKKAEVAAWAVASVAARAAKEAEGTGKAWVSRTASAAASAAREAVELEATLLGWSRRAARAAELTIWAIRAAARASEAAEPAGAPRIAKAVEAKAQSISRGTNLKLLAVELLIKLCEMKD